ncbi:MAG: SDR family NAD(P)-dependent oxidoreductase [Thermoguttaceae bacterium]
MSAETALITGASSGIGLELAKLFAADKSNLVLVARSKEKLDQLADELRRAHGIEIRVLPRDLADPAAPQAIFDELAANGVQVDVLVNNAGFGASGPFADIPFQRQLEMIQVNVTTLTHLTRLFLPAMIERRRGGILNVGSTASFQPGPMMAVYCATKAFVLSFTEALAEEVVGAAVTVTCLAPGATETGFAATAGMSKSFLFRSGAMDVRTVARAGYRGFRAGKVLVVPGVKNTLTIFSLRLAPRAVVRRIAKWMLESDQYRTPPFEHK